jgi:hypothetical protein
VGVDDKACVGVSSLEEFVATFQDNLADSPWAALCGLVEGDSRGDRRVTVMTRNFYLGASLGRTVAAEILPSSSRQ